jgi:glutamate synthase (NADPH/NADH) small chain
VGDEAGRVKELHTIQVEWVMGDNGRPYPQEIPGTDKVWPAQLVLLAMGFLGPENGLLSQLGVEQDERSNVRAEYGKYATSRPGVFAAGDARRRSGGGGRSTRVAGSRSNRPLPRWGGIHLKSRQKAGL